MSQTDITPKPRRNVELVLIVLALAVGIGASALVSINSESGLDNDFWKPIQAYWAEPTSKDNREALRGFTKLEATKWQYTHGVKNPELVSPDAWTADQYLLDRDGNADIQLDLFLSYGSNPPLYPKWQAYFRKHQPPVLIAWGKHDQIFPAAGVSMFGCESICA